MYVQCERCRAEYDFDDALVSERGTTVKCTNCGHQFKVRRATSDGQVDRWVVTRTGGEEVVLTSLKELQRAILAKRVAREDVLARTGSPTRTLGSIAELEPFFDERKRTSSIPPEGARPYPQVRVSSLPPPPRGGSRSHLSEPPRRSDMPPMRARTPTLRPPDLGGAVPPPPPTEPPPVFTPAVADSGAHDVEPVPVRRSDPPPPPVARPRSVPPPVPRRGPSQPAAIEVSSPLPPPAYRRSVISEMEDEPPVDPAASLPPPAPRRYLGWIVAVVLLGGAMIVGAFAIRPYLAGRGAAQVAEDPRVSPLLAAGEAALASGDLDTAQTSFDKASAFAEKDPKVLVDLARVANARADVPWLRQRLLPNESDAMEVNKKTLAELADRAKAAADAAVAVAPEDPAALRVKVDALRIHDEHDAARALVGKINGNVPGQAQPELAYILGALDLSELDPPWPEVLEHLGAAVAGEGFSGRARAAYIYALARSGDTKRAQEELDRLGSLPHPHPLLAELRAYVEHASPAGDAGAPVKVAGGTASTGGGAPIPAAGTGAGGGGGGGGSVGAAPTGDPRALLAQAEAAKQHKELPRARSLYDAVLAKNPGDSEALAGLGDVSHAEKDLGGAQAFYKRALAANPSFMPALIGLADVQWESGDRAAAQKSYKDIVDRFPEGSYPSYVHSRSEPAAAPATSAAAPTASATPAPTSETAPAASSEAP